MNLTLTPVKGGKASVQSSRRSDLARSVMKAAYLTAKGGHEGLGIG